MRVIANAEDLLAAQGTELGVGPWFQVRQSLISDFGRVTDDQQWIHDDPDLASRGPFGCTIAHGFLTLGLIPRLSRETFRIEGARMSINYGIDRVRFPQPVLVDSMIRARAVLESVVQRKSGLQATVDYTIEIKGSKRPACIARTLRLVVY